MHKMRVRQMCVNLADIFKDGMFTIVKKGNCCVCLLSYAKQARPVRHVKTFAVFYKLNAQR